MADGLKNEATYDRERLEQRIAGLQRDRGISRREAVRLLAGAVLSAGFAIGSGAALPLSAQAQAVEPPIVKPTPPELFRTLGTNRESVFAAFKDLGYLTPASHFFIRNHTRTPRIDASTWRLRFEGSGLKRPFELTYDQLLQYKPVTRTKAIECAGNGRSFFDTQQGTRAAGTAWQLGAIGVAQWTGVPLRDVLLQNGLKRTAVDVMPEGLDDVVGSDGHVRRPFPIEKALDDVLIVYGMNGETLPQDHGFPARILVPGWIGISNIKWVGRIEVSETPLFSAWNTTQYRLIGEAYPEPQLITQQVVKSAFELPFGATIPSGWQTLTGRSWSAHGRIRSVEVSFSQDGPWWPAHELQPGTGNDPQAWAQWSIAWPATPGEHVLRARATDSLGNTQSLDPVPFNTNGYLFGGVVNHRVTVV